MSLNRNFSVGFITSIWSALLDLAVVPLYLKYLGTEAYRSIVCNYASFVADSRLKMETPLSRPFTAKVKLSRVPKISFEELISEMAYKVYKSDHYDELAKHHGFSTYESS